MGDRPPTGVTAALRRGVRLRCDLRGESDMLVVRRSWSAAGCGGGVCEPDGRWRSERDATLGEPRLMHCALQVNVRAGRLPEGPVKGGGMGFYMPVKVEGEAW